MAATRETKFTPGFFRRHASNIDNTSERIFHQEKKDMRVIDHIPRRLGKLHAESHRNGDILAHIEDPPPQYRYNLNLV